MRVWLAVLLAVPAFAAPAPAHEAGAEMRAAREERFVHPTAHRGVDVVWRESSGRRVPHSGPAPFLPGSAPALLVSPAPEHAPAPGRALPVPRSAHHPPYYATAPPASLR